MDRPIPFGREGCVTPAVVARIDHDALKAEAILLAFETGLSAEDIEATLGIDAWEIARLELRKYQPFQRQGETV